MSSDWLFFLKSLSLNLFLHSSASQSDEEIEMDVDSEQSDGELDIKRTLRFDGIAPHRQRYEL